MNQQGIDSRIRNRASRWFHRPSTLDFCSASPEIYQPWLALGHFTGQGCLVFMTSSFLCPGLGQMPLTRQWRWQSGGWGARLESLQTFALSLKIPSSAAQNPHHISVTGNIGVPVPALLVSAAGLLPLWSPFNCFLPRHSGSLIISIKMLMESFTGSRSAPQSWPQCSHPAYIPFGVIIQIKKILQNFYSNPHALPYRYP